MSLIAPALTAHEIRDRMAAGYLESYRRAGMSLTPAEAEALAISDCELIDAARRAGELSGGPKDPAKLNPARERPDPLLEAQRETNTRLVVSGEGEPEYQRYRFMHRNPMLISERWGAACARINRILEGAARATTFEKAASGAEYPALVHAYQELWSYFLTRQMPPPSKGVDHNPFRHMSDSDAAWKFMRLVEDICDRSTGVLGSWFVK